MIKSVYEDRILIKITPSEEGEYIIPQGHEPDEELSGTVVYIGEEVKNTIIGDIVVFDQYDYSKITINDVGYILTREENLICKIGKDE